MPNLKDTNPRLGTMTRRAALTPHATDAQSCSANIAFQAISAVYAVLAAILWFQASREKPVTQVLRKVERLSGPDIFKSHFVEKGRSSIRAS
jgi:hypothetical protein